MSDDKYKNYTTKITNWEIRKNANEAFAGHMWFVKRAPAEVLFEKIDKNWPINVETELGDELITGLTLLQISHRKYLQSYYDIHQFEKEIKWELKYIKLTDNEDWNKYKELIDKKKEIEKKLKPIEKKKNRSDEENKNYQTYSKEKKEIKKTLDKYTNNVKQTQLTLFEGNCDKRLYFLQEMYHKWQSVKSTYFNQTIYNDMYNEFVPKPLDLETCYMYIKAMEKFYDEKFKNMRKIKKTENICNYLNESIHVQNNDDNDDNDTNEDQRTIRDWFNVTFHIFHTIYILKKNIYIVCIELIANSR